MIRGGGGRKAGANSVAEADAGKMDSGTKGKRNGATAMAEKKNKESWGEGGGGSQAQGRRDSSEGGCGSRVGGETRGYRGRIKSRSRDRGGDRYERNLVDRDSRDNKK